MLKTQTNGRMKSTKYIWIAVTNLLHAWQTKVKQKQQEEDRGEEVKINVV